MITLEANYSKKLGLPGYSSHQYSLTVRKEVIPLKSVGSGSEEAHSFHEVWRENIASFQRILEAKHLLAEWRHDTNSPPITASGNSRDLQRSTRLAHNARV